MTARGVEMKFVAFTIVTVLAMQVQGAETQKIPLKEIWGYKMPGTLDIEELTKKTNAKLLDSIFESWAKRAERLNFKEMARPGFAVSGTGLSALQAAHAVFVEGKKPREEFTTEEEITVVFFSEYASGNHVRIRDVIRKGNHIEIRYRLEPYFTSNFSVNLAMIPVGKMPGEKYHVEMRQLPREQRFIKARLQALDEEWSRGLLCKPFGFTVVERGGKRRTSAARRGAAGRGRRRSLGRSRCCSSREFSCLGSGGAAEREVRRS